MPTIQAKDCRDYRSEGGQIFFCGGKAYGLTPRLQTLCLGSEAEILQALSENKLTGHVAINNILLLELGNRGKKKTKRPLEYT